MLQLSVTKLRTLKNSDITGMVVHAYNPNLWERKAGPVEVPGQSLSYIVNLRPD